MLTVQCLVLTVQCSLFRVNGWGWRVVWIWTPTREGWSQEAYSKNQTTPRMYASVLCATVRLCAPVCATVQFAYLRLCAPLCTYVVCHWTSPRGAWSRAVHTQTQTTSQTY